MNVLIEEIQDLLPRTGRGWSRIVLLYVAIFAVFGIVVPLRKGLEFYDPMVLTAYACLGTVFAVPVAVRGLADNSLPRVMARIAAALLYGEGMALGLVALGIFTVYWSHRGRIYFSPAWEGVGAGVLFGFTLTLALVISGIWLTLALTDSAAKFLLRVILLAALVAFLFQGRGLPDVIYPATGVAFVVAIVAFALLRREVRRRQG